MEMPGGDGPHPAATGDEPEPAPGLVASLEVSHLAVKPGSATHIAIPVTNTGEVIDGVTAIVDGVDPDWVRLDRPVVSIFPDETEVVGISFDIPAQCAAGDYLVVVRTVSTLDIERQSVHDFWLTVDPVDALDVTLTPQVVTGGASGKLVARVHNAGNAVANVRVVALDPARDVDVIVDPGSFFLEPGSFADVDVLLRGPRPWFGEPASRQIQITSTVNDLEIERVATFNRRPRISRGVITMIILALIILLWAVIFLFAINALRSSEPAAKATASAFPGGEENIPLALIAATVDGAVTAETTGAGVARVTVEAFRVKADESLEPSGSAATLDDGTFTLPSLLPGTYVFKVSSDGFEELWYPAAATSADADRIGLDPTSSFEGLDVVLVGEPGQIVGTLERPANTPDVPLEVTVTQKPEGATSPDEGADGTAPGGESGIGVDSSDEPDADGLFTTSQITTDGTIAIDGLPTPATYQVTVTGDGFATLSFDQEVDGGAPTVLDTVSVSAAAGEISGTVLNQSSVPAGDITVTVRSGSFIASAVTPTSGDVGTFRFVGLSTPATYTITFEAPLFQDSTVALELGPGEAATEIVGRVIGGNGTITGSARTFDGAAAGGLTVEVVGDGFRQETATLTSSGPGGAAGTFSMTNIPVPGSYTVTLSGEGFQTETLDAVFLAAGAQAVGEVVMVSETSQISGRVLSGGTGIGQATVTLSSGTREFVTIAASNPAGQFAFSGVAEGTYTLTVEQNGFEPRVVLIRVESGVDLVRDIGIIATS